MRTKGRKQSEPCAVDFNCDYQSVCVWNAKPIYECNFKTICKNAKRNKIKFVFDDHMSHMKNIRLYTCTHLIHNKLQKVALVGMLDVRSPNKWLTQCCTHVFRKGAYAYFNYNDKSLASYGARWTMRTFVQCLSFWSKWVYRTKNERYNYTFSTHIQIIYVYDVNTYEKQINKYIDMHNQYISIY